MKHALVNRREAGAVDDGAITLIGVKKVEGRLGLYPENPGSVLPVALLELGKGQLALAELSVKSGQLDWKAIVCLSFLLKTAQLPLNHSFVAGLLEGTLDGGSGDGVMG